MDSVEVYYPVSTASEVQKYIEAALAHVDHTELLPFSSEGDAQVVLDEIWKVLHSPVLLSTYRSRLHRLSLKVALQYDVLPTSLILNGVTCTDTSQHGAGGFADVYCGFYDGSEVALKRLRIYTMMSGVQKEALKKSFYLESLLWKNLVHAHILPFLGVTEDVFPGTVCMVIPWMEKGNLRHHIETEQSEGRLVGPEFETQINAWLYQTALGLAYLHAEGVVHGDMHAGNILIDETGTIRLTDFGLSVISEGTAYNYGSQHGGGATRWTAPELFDPEEFGLENTRPTFLSDVYAFACVCIELYTGKPPFSELSDRQVPLRVVRGDRPPRPLLPDGTPMSSIVWSLTQSSWSHVPAERPTAENVANGLRTVADASAEVDPLLYMRSAVNARMKELRPDDAERKWLQGALTRTFEFYKDGPAQPFSWVLVVGQHVWIPNNSVEISEGDNTALITYTARKWSWGPWRGLNADSLREYPALFPEILAMMIVTYIQKFSRPHTHLRADHFMEHWGNLSNTIREVLVASPAQVHWVPSSGKLDLRTLGARPVDGYTLDHNILSGMMPYLPLCILRTRHDGQWQPAAMRSASPGLYNVYSMAQWDVNVETYEILCHTE